MLPYNSAPFARVNGELGVLQLRLDRLIGVIAPGERQPGQETMTHFSTLKPSGNWLPCFITDKQKWVAVQTKPSKLIDIGSQQLTVNLK